jgi:tetratricopeptide (TPR) repeat protein
LELAKKYNDSGVYKNTLYELIAIEGENSPYKDTLADYYFNSGEFISFLLLNDERLKKHPDNTDYMLKQALAFEQIGNIKKAVEYFEKVYAVRPDDLKTGFQLAWNQYQLKRIDETYRTLMSMKDKPFPENVFVKIPGVQNKIINVPLKAAYYNLLGLTSYDLHNLDMAVKYFDEALKIHPDFELAKQNKAAVELMKQKLESQPGDKDKKNNGN